MDDTLEIGCPCGCGRAHDPPLKQAPCLYVETPVDLSIAAVGMAVRKMIFSDAHPTRLLVHVESKTLGKEILGRLSGRIPAGIEVVVSDRIPDSYGWLLIGERWFDA